MVTPLDLVRLQIAVPAGAVIASDRVVIAKTPSVVGLRQHGRLAARPTTTSWKSSWRWRAACFSLHAGAVAGRVSGQRMWSECEVLPTTIDGMESGNEGGRALVCARHQARLRPQTPLTSATGRTQAGYADAQPVANSGAQSVERSSSGWASAPIRATQESAGVAG